MISRRMSMVLVAAMALFLLALPVAEAADPVKAARAARHCREARARGRLTAPPPVCSHAPRERGQRPGARQPGSP